MEIMLSLNSTVTVAIAMISVQERCRKQVQLQLLFKWNLHKFKWNKKTVKDKGWDVEIDDLEIGHLKGWGYKCMYISSLGTIYSSKIAFNLTDPSKPNIK